MTDDPLVNPQLPDSIDIATMLISWVGGAVPMVGGSLADFANRCLKANYEMAMEDFFTQLADRVNRLTDDQEDLKRRLQEPEFTEFVTRAVRVAETSSQKEKRAWLANAVVNCLREDPADNLDRLRNLRMIDQIMPMHVNVLRFLKDPSPWLAQWGTTLPTEPDTDDGQALTHAMPQLVDETYAHAVLVDLHEMELVSLASRKDFAAMFTGEAEEPYSLPPVTARAASLLAFISEAA